MSKELYSKETIFAIGMILTLGGLLCIFIDYDSKLWRFLFISGCLCFQISRLKKV